MKTSVFAFVLVSFFSGNTFAKSELPLLICNSLEKIEGWDGQKTLEKLTYTAYITGPKELKDAVVKGAYLSDKRDVKVFKETKNYMQFDVLEDAWNWFVLSVPKEMTTLTHGFIGYVNIYAEEQYGYSGVEMKCFVKQPTQVNTPSSEAMRQLAQDIGEYFSEDEVSAFGYEATMLSENNMPAKLKTKMKTIWRDTDEALHPGGRVGDISVFKINMSGSQKTTGFIIYVDEFYENEPLHDGSGTTYYLNLNFETVERVDWVG